MQKKKKTMPSGKPGHGSKRPTDAQPQNEILRSRGLGGEPSTSSAGSRMAIQGHCLPVSVYYSFCAL